MEYQTWDEAMRAGYSLVVRTGRLSDTVEEDLRLGRLAAKALVLDVSSVWISEMLADCLESRIEDVINRRCH